MSEKEVNKLIEDGQLEHKTEYGLTTVTKESVYAYTGISTSGNQTKKKGKGGRPPATMSYAEAAEILEENIPILVETGELEACDNGITKRSVKAYKKKLADAEVKECESDTDGEAEALEAADAPGPLPETDATDIHVGETEENCIYPKCSCPFDIGEDGKCFKGLPSRVDTSADLSDSTDMTERDECVPHDRDMDASEDRENQDYFESEEHKRKCAENEKWMAEKAAREEELMAAEKITGLDESEELLEEPLPETRSHDEEEESVTLSKSDFHAAMSLAGMRAELGVYRSLKSFERR
jgi:hypothetical protein